MKNTIAIVTLLAVLTFLFTNKALAFTIPNIRIVTIAPTATPIIIQKIDPNINLKLIVTIAPTTAPTATPTLEAKLTVTPKPTIKEITETPTISQTPSVQPSVEATKTVENVENKMDLKSVFVNITLGLLVLIIVIQLWPKKNEK
jgi:hypothetical protein